MLEVSGRPGGGKFTHDDERLLTTFADQVALAMERTRLTEEATRAAVLDESDRLKTAMLAAVSHDLRTPLAAIKASASTLRDHSIEWGPDVREELLGAIEEETDRLTLMVSNLLDLSRIEGGALRPDRAWNDPGELVHDVERQVRQLLGQRTLVVHMPDDMPLVLFDYIEIAQVLLNLVGNAIKYSDDSTAIEISRRRWRRSHGNRRPRRRDGDSGVRAAVRLRPVRAGPGPCARHGLGNRAGDLQGAG